MEEYEKHILDSYTDSAKKISYCGEDISMEFYFVDVTHAVNEVQRGGRLMPCPKCREIVIGYLNGNYEAKELTT